MNKTLTYVRRLPEQYEIVEGNDVIVMDGGELKNPVVLNSGTCIVSSGGVVSGATVAHFATLIVSSGGTATDVEVVSNGRLKLDSGGFLKNCTVQFGGHVYLWNGGKYTGLRVIDEDSIVWKEVDRYSNECYSNIISVKEETNDR